MPFRSLAALKKLTNLGAEVVDIAPLDDASIVAVLTSDPVKLSIHRYAGSDRGKVTSVSLDDVRSVALIDRGGRVSCDGNGSFGAGDPIRLIGPEIGQKPQFAFGTEGIDRGEIDSRAAGDLR